MGSAEFRVAETLRLFGSIPAQAAELHNNSALHCSFSSQSILEAIALCAEHQPHAPQPPQAPQAHNRTVGSKMSESEYAKLAALARQEGQTLGEWRRGVLRQRTKICVTKPKGPLDSTLLIFADVVSELE